ncbi:cobalamin B12-binding domain-containing protein [Methanolobus psychrotolerans]|uniref:cobalamin B12-binding domain-containing protein n=1 Tax=Methanolobus psychrotolerans TaxID=1874706 RepID=UPI000B91D0D0|nr:cobalamin-dependent protein [Methanolobus psychrotolerans]
MGRDKFQVREFKELLLSLNRVAAKNLITSKFTGDNAFELINEIIAPALESIGDMWSLGQIALSQEYMASKICEEIVEMILPAESPYRKNMPAIGITTLGDEHMLGKRIVTSYLKANGFNVYDYGDMGPDKIGMKVKDDGIEVLMASTLMLNLAFEVKKLRLIFDREGIKTKIIVGGAPFLFDRDLWKEVGADAMAVDAMESVNKIYDVLRYPNEQ